MKMKLAVTIMSLLTILTLLVSSWPRPAAAQDPPEHHLFLPLVVKNGQSSNTPSNEGLWTDVVEASIGGQGERLIIPQKYRTLAADLTILDAILTSAPLENTPAAQNIETVLSLPLPDGTFGWFRIEESPIMEPALAAKFPEIKTYQGWGLDDPTATARLDWTPAGFHAMILSVSDTVYIDPYRRGDIAHYISYYKQDYSNIWGKSLSEDPILPVNAGNISAAVSSGPTLHTYRLAVAATGEYTAFHGGTVAQALAAINTTLNRVNGIYLREASIQMSLIANNDDIIYTNAATDPYTNGSPGTMIGENQTNVDAEIGSGNYDIGHVFGTNSGGLAGLGVVCNNSSKARGVTGSGAPIGDPFDVDYVAHEMGHQYGANHTFNASATGSCTGGNRNGGTAYEPGSGSTIMAYAGICGTQDLQPNSDDHFHGISFDEITNYVTAGTGNSCGTHTATGNNTPTANAGANYTIPRNTPFILTGTGSDPDGDSLSYHWEEFDLGPPPADETVLPNTDADGNARPIFRSYSPAMITSRTFPMLSSILNGSNSNNGESLPNIDRVMQFRLTVRDGRGGVNNDGMAVTVEDGAGPFAVTSPNTPVTWNVNDSETVTWDVAASNAAPVNCANVNILLSTDGGSTFPIVLAANTANDGAESITVPNNETGTARVKVACADNIFFDISNTNFTIMGSADLSIAKTDTPDPVIAGTSLTYELSVANNGPSNASDVTITDDLPASTTLISATPSQGSCSGTDTVTCAIGNLASGNSATVTIVVHVLASTADGAILNNTAEVTANEADPSTGNNTATAETAVIREADLAITKTDATDPAVAGENLTYTIEVSNDGPSDAADVTVVDVLPSEVSYVSDTDSCTEAPVGTLTCDLGNLAAGASTQFDITVFVAPDAVFNAGGPTTIINVVGVSSPTDDPNPFNNETSEDTLVIAVADLEIVSFEAVDPPAEVLVGEDVEIVLRKEITNNGPSGPMDVELSKTATAPTDSTVTPTASTTEELALGLNESREVFEVFTINCGQASHHTFSFTNEIQPLHPEDTDPDLSNNFASLELDIECVVPVAIDIKPKQIVLKGQGVVAVVVLTTSAGEYGLPLDFDASTIEPLSVRFGPHDAIWFETGGAAESHAQGHGMGIGMMFHFIAVETGLAPGDTEACIKGTWIDANGDAHKFFGCDEVTVK